MHFKTKKVILFAIILIATLQGCFFLTTDRRTRNNFTPNISSYKPIIIAKKDLPSTIITNSTGVFSKAGKIYYKAPYLFINEKYKGVHIFDNTNPSDPKPLNFIQVLGCLDMAVKGNTMYVDNACDMVVLDITDPKNVQIVKRLKNVFETSNLTPDFFRYYPHPDSTIINWVKR